MNLRKFYFILTVILSVFLFGGGVYIVHSMSTIADYDTSAEGRPGNAFEALVRPLAIGREPFNVLLLVGDKEESNTDTIMLVNYNPSNNNVSVMSIPRDTRIEMEGVKFPKVNSFYQKKNGQELVTNALNKLLGVHVNYYVYLNIKTFREIIDSLGGVDYYVPADMYYNDPNQKLRIDLRKGQQKLDGDKAEQLLRFRHPNGPYKKWSADIKKIYDGSDVKRVQVQQNFIRELVKQKANLYYLPKINSIIQIVYKNLETNMPQNEFLKLVKNIAGFKLDKVKFFTLPGVDKMVNGVSYYVYDEEKMGDTLTENFHARPAYSSYNNLNEGVKQTYVGTKSSSSISSSGSGSSSTKKTDAKKSYTKNNPSNKDSTLTGSQTPAP